MHLHIMAFGIGHVSQAITQLRTYETFNNILADSEIRFELLHVNET